MPELKCTVETCIHNKYCCCDKGSIDVDGSAAKSKSETCCSSFADSAMSNYSNSAKAASLTSQIHCNASNCQYNKGGECEAGCVEVQGSNACQCGDTECASFCECNC